MAEKKALSMDEAKQKLAELKKYLPDATDDLIDFGCFLAGRLNPTLAPRGFVIACGLALYDLQQGIDGLTKKPIHSKLVGYPSMIYGLIRMEIPEIAKAIFPEEFAVGVKTMFDEINATMQAKSSPQ